MFFFPDVAGVQLTQLCFLEGILISHEGRSFFPRLASCSTVNNRINPLLCGALHQMLSVRRMTDVGFGAEVIVLEGLMCWSRCGKSLHLSLLRSRFITRHLPYTFLGTLKSPTCYRKKRIQPPPPPFSLLEVQERGSRSPKLYSTTILPYEKQMWEQRSGEIKLGTSRKAQKKV
ncbi:uncharacterized protein BO95DRAFT_133774 [Aspergillus brunneoviolaceus CBS 621.78]|uniref:Uncharacterized protein n=1 Tax=Aspergillus brunneoviolaceus CBS 621.78 TaxID=1450534 RepID=A0ACD1G9F3_9EURO|nr:hypothetical protein BO95DRAFT_133774 [Aspergillus brunneoviolaceus CBS 621.78]RAH45769.1 hypothetical protein BO95DRAFT_133774 [Aspergillus brunneoviolaceus CBS 621.78]